MGKSRSPEPEDPAITAKAERMIRNLRQHYESGKKGKQEKEKLKGKVTELAAAQKTNISTFRKERAFAAAYTDEELDELCDLRRPNGLPLEWGFIPYLLTIPSKAERREWQERAAKKGWNATEMYAEIRRDRGTDSTRGRGGRPITVPRTAEDQLRDMTMETERWLRRHEIAWNDEHKGILKQTNSLKSASLREQIRSLVENLRRMAGAASAAAKVLEASQP